MALPTTGGLFSKSILKQDPFDPLSPGTSYGIGAMPPYAGASNTGAAVSPDPRVHPAPAQPGDTSLPGHGDRAPAATPGKKTPTRTSDIMTPGMPSTLLGDGMDPTTGKEKLRTASLLGL